MQQFRHARLRLEDESGMTLIEMMAALFILSLTMVALLSSVLTSLRSLDVSKHRQDATQLASSTLESVRGIPFESVALDGGSTPLPPSGFEGDDVIVSPTGALPHVGTTASGFTITTWVTEVDSGTDERRVTVVIEWDDRGATRSLRQSTVVAEAKRGLPAPDFDIGPDDPNGLFIVGTDMTCIDHQLTNLGESDKYDWKLSDAGNWSVSADYDGDGTDEIFEGFRHTATGWEVFAVLIDEAGNWTALFDQTTDLRPDTADFVGRAETVVLEFCYVPPSSPVTGTFSFEHTVRSTFDSTVMEVVTDTLEVSSSIFDLYFHQPLQGNNFKTGVTALIANPTLPTNTNVSQNFDKCTGTSPPECGYPGLQVPAGTSIVWDYQVPDDRVLSDAMVSLHVAGGTGGIGGAEATTISYQLALERVSDGSQLSTAAQTTTVQRLTGSTAAASKWKLVEVALTPAVPTSYIANDYVRVRFTCTPQPLVDANCHVHYDINVLSSKLRATMDQP